MKRKTGDRFASTKIGKPQKTSTKIGKPQKSNKHKKIKDVKFDDDILKEVLPRKKLCQRNRLSAKSPNNTFQEIPKHILKESLSQTEIDDSDQKKKKNKKKKNLNTDGNTPLGLNPKVNFTQKKNESTHAFFHRMDRICKDVIEETKHPINLEKTDANNANESSDKNNSKETNKRIQKKVKMKKRLDNFKEKNRTRKIAKCTKNDTGFDHLKDNVEFGEVAMAPPILKSAPRKADQLSKAGSRSLILSSMLKTTDNKNYYQKREIGKTLKTKHLTPLQQLKEHSQRQAAIEAYRNLKSKPKKDFHDMNIFD